MKNNLIWISIRFGFQTLQLGSAPGENLDRHVVNSTLSASTDVRPGHGGPTKTRVSDLKSTYLPLQRPLHAASIENKSRIDNRISRHAKEQQTEPRC